MLRITLFLLFVIFLLTVILILKMLHDKIAEKDEPTKPADDLDRVVGSWETSDRNN